MEGIYEMIAQQCQGVLRFGEVLSDTLVEQHMSQTAFAVLIHYSDAVVSRLVNKQELPRWLNIRELMRITECLNCTDRQTGRLISAFLCDTLRNKGLYDGLQR